ncbi:N-terminal domain of NEFA-interacting nuclear protein NIP30-domain-containing protein [Diaporthe sp. PMI_573]|nr:N-terminal domain of NEFA-interacting nuclear protein NIP30-domain-containing protein [Diaporthaceae sp. PMI_573]
MTSRFVSGGTTDTKTGEIVPADPSTSTSAAATAAAGSAKRSEEWAAVQAQVEEDRRRRQQQKEEAARGGEGDKSLYEVLQANKAAKQAAFEEANKLKNQFRPLDDDEVEFLDGVRERRRAEEERLRRDTEEGLKGFRELQSKMSSSGEGAAGDEGAVEGGGGWSVGRKRKRRKDEPEGLLKGLKRRSSAAADGVEDEKAEEKDREGAAGEAGQESPTSAAAKDAQDTQKSVAKPAAPAAAAAKPKIGLVDYGSDDDSD